jgi:hypothetical protein
MGVIGYAAIILAVTRRAVWPLASPLASRQSKSVAGGRLVERLSIVRWMGLGLTHPRSADGVSERSAWAR